MYRDAYEWENLESIFAPDAYIYTTWTGRTHNKANFPLRFPSGPADACHGASTEINPSATRATTKMEATITQRFTIHGCDVDAESDCRFCFFWEKGTSSPPATGIPDGEWRARFVRHWYEKDKLIPINPAKVPTLDEEKLQGFPTGYRYLAYCQEATMGVKVMLDMPGTGERAITCVG
ncbi:hypothetical protein LTR16_001772 [Cryomyces antarcticus]|uniref:SnoaL-like domain-containing protein n=1 Tax=Cryomyces antarcticus TaxID=329879 RepID=A0ABR0M8C3_9PEZI|nr:hypothetical protein LTR16_001772 [Cryomyces antarcticus]